MRFVRTLESGLLVLLLTGMIVVAAWQVFARIAFDSGLPWGDAFVRVIVLWVAMLGAMVAARRDDHIRIDLLGKFASERMLRLGQRVAALLTVTVLALFTWSSFEFVRYEYEDGIIAFASVPAWLCESIMPLAGFVMMVRYILHAWNPPERLPE
ncbi:MAG: TRAP transporter small permease [Pseudomonadales bacterium]|nr:TRAP transporter small permease [Pseudomonadales bacterium]MCP5182926.1 TRAP transporter small permease [Pseudomonadales bacterium]